MGVFKGFPGGQEGDALGDVSTWFRARDDLREGDFAADIPLP